MNAAKIISKRSKTVRQTSGESDPNPARGDQKRDPRPSGDYKGREGMGRREQTIKETKHAREGRRRTGRDREAQACTERDGKTEARGETGGTGQNGKTGKRGKREKTHRGAQFDSNRRKWRVKRKNRRKNAKNAGKTQKTLCGLKVTDVKEKRRKTQKNAPRTRLARNEPNRWEKRT